MQKEIDKSNDALIGQGINHDLGSALPKTAEVAGGKTPRKSEKDYAEMAQKLMSTMTLDEKKVMKILDPGIEKREVTIKEVTGLIARLDNYPERVEHIAEIQLTSISRGKDQYPDTWEQEGPRAKARMTANRLFERIERILGKPKKTQILEHEGLNAKPIIEGITDEHKKIIAACMGKKGEKITEDDVKDFVRECETNPEKIEILAGKHIAYTTRGIDKNNESSGSWYWEGPRAKARVAKAQLFQKVNQTTEGRKLEYKPYELSSEALKKHYDES
jgi:hypothetical protein